MAQVAESVSSQPEVVESASMPNREEKSQVAEVWRVTWEGNPAANRCACKKLEAAAGKSRGRKYGATVSVDSTEEDVIMLRWDPPRKYDSVLHFLNKHLKNYNDWKMSRMMVAPVDGKAEVKDETDKKEEKKGTQEEDTNEEKSEDQNVAVSVASTAPVGQQLSGRHLPLKLQHLLQCRPSSED